MRVAIAEDAALFRSGLALLLGSHGLEVVTQARSGTELLLTVGRRPADVAILDIRMNGTDEGVGTAVTLRREHPQIGILMLSAHADSAYAGELLGSLNSHFGYLLKDRVADAPSLVRDLERIHGGDVVLDPTIVARLFRKPTNADRLGVLTPQELEVLRGMAEGWSNAGIGRKLSMSPRTVEAHVTRIFNSLGLAEVDGDQNRRVHAVLAFLRADGPR